MKWNINENIEAFERLKRNVNLFTTPRVSRVIATLVYSDIKTKFEDEKDVKGNQFKPLKASTIRNKQRTNKIPYKILRDTGQLLNSLNYNISHNGIIIGYSVPYAKFHQHGTKKMAQRKILPTDESEIPIKEIRTIIKNYFKEL